MEITKKEKEIQKALGTMPQCDTCDDEGEYRRYFQYSSSKDVYPCESCIKGILLEHTRTMDDLSRRDKNKKDGILCNAHPDYKAFKKPDVLCNSCWTAWLAGVFYVRRKYLSQYVQNERIE